MRTRLVAVAPLLAALAVAGVLAGPARADYELRDGDTVVFLGDSLTAARTYGKVVENYTLLRFPARRVRFFNAGIGGDTAAASLTRLERDVFSHRPTVVTVCFGLNDVGWGLKADDAHVKAYVEALQTIVREAKKRGARTIYLTPPVTNEDPVASEKGLLAGLAERGSKAVRAAGGDVIDVQRGLREIQKRIWSYNSTQAEEKGKVALHLADGVHLSDLGQLALAFTILQGLGAPAQVSAAAVDAGRGVATRQEGCRVSDVAADKDQVSFTRLDEGLPINFGLFGALQMVWVPFHATMNRYGLQVTGLAPGLYEVLADDRPIGAFDAKLLAQGLDVASRTASAWAPGGPWDAQASVLSQLTDARHALAAAVLLDRLWLPGTRVLSPHTADAERADAELIALQRQAAEPRPYRFVVRRAAPAAAGGPSPK